MLLTTNVAQLNYYNLFEQHVRDFNNQEGRMNDHVNDYHRGNRSSYAVMFDIFILDHADQGDLRSFELFWQWLFRALEDFGGAGRR
jgi:hypothetical protein